MLTRALGSVVIAAHNEEAVMARTLAGLQEVLALGLIDVIVVCNGCQDRTAEVAGQFSRVRVCELPVPSKTAALREGDRIALPGPRIYLDADVELTGQAAVATLRALSVGTLAGRPPHQFETARAGWTVQRWYAVRERLPSVASALWGAGCYALSEAGRERFVDFPDSGADDLFIDSLFARDEVVIVRTDPLVVRTPRTVGDLMRRKYRKQAHTPGFEGSRERGVSAGQRRQLHELRALIRREPRWLADAAIYILLIALARLGSRIGPAHRWERDESSRARD